MILALIADTFPPLRTSGAVQLQDLCREFSQQGHSITIILPAPRQKERWQLKQLDGFDVLRLKVPRFKDVGYVRRALGELVMPFAMLYQFKNSPLAKKKFEGVIWYSPSIFHGPLVSVIKRGSACRSYMIIRDIFPEWAVDIGLMGRGLPYRFFDSVTRYQNSVADVIGVQSHGNLSYFDRWLKKPGRTLEVLHNWLGAPVQKSCSINVANSHLSGRKIFVYAGNMGLAQGIDILLDLAERLLRRQDIGFLFVGRGSDVVRLKNLANNRGLSNVAFFDEIHPDEIPALYKQCAIGLVALDPKHKSHNIPGKFLTYMQNALPVLAVVNRGNDLASIICTEDVGKVCETHDLPELSEKAIKLIDRISDDNNLQKKCLALFAREFHVRKTVQQIIAALVR